MKHDRERFAMTGLGATYGTGELAPVSGIYQIVGHEIPASAGCTSHCSGPSIKVLKHTPLPSHGRCGQGALWCLVVAGDWRYTPQRSVASRRTPLPPTLREATS